MGLVEADLDPGVRVSMGTFCIPSHAPLEDHPLATHCEPSALYCWILGILYCDPNGRRALLRVPSSEGRSVCLCWAKSKPKGQRTRKQGLSADPAYGYARCSPLLGESKTVWSKRIGLNAPTLRARILRGYLAHKNLPFPSDHRRALGIVLLYGPRSEVLPVDEKKMAPPAVLKFLEWKLFCNQLSGRKSPEFETFSPSR